MKITIDKLITPANLIPTYREKIKQFKAYYTDNDLRQMFERFTGINIYGDIIKCDVEAFPVDRANDDAYFYVTIITDALTTFQRTRFYIVEQDGQYALDLTGIAETKTYR